MSTANTVDQTGDPAGDDTAQVDLHRSPADRERLRLVLIRLGRRIRTSSSDMLVTPSQRAILGTIAKHGEVTIGEIAEVERVQPPSVSKIVSGLEARGLVDRLANPKDRRSTLIRINDAGRDVLDQMRDASRSWLATQLADLSETDVEALAVAMPALERLLDGP